MKIAALLIFFITSVSFPQLLKPFAEKFISDLVNENNITEYLLPEELDISKRMGINYDSVNNKFLISYDIDPAIKEKIKNHPDGYNLEREKLEEGYYRNTLSVPSENYKKQFYFKDTFLISPPSYHSKNWKKIVSKYFTFFLSDSTLFNTYCLDKLDHFIETISSKLEYSKEELDKLEKQKIYYFLCKDEKEVELLTGYQARGNYILAFDYIVTTYNCHYHEIVHLLMNYKLKNLPLYTHPFFQEGIAVALGGRGGYEPDIMLNVGKFLDQSEMFNYESIMNINDYKSIDPSMTYPLSGIYNLFLLNEIGITNYTGLYRKYSGSYRQLQGLTITKPDLPEISAWKNFVDTFSSASIYPGKKEETIKVLIKDGLNKISEAGVDYIFEIKDNLLISLPDPILNFNSKKFKEEFPGRAYTGEKYLIKVNKAEASLYNLYTNNLIASYAAGFSIDMKPVPSEKGVFIFSIPKFFFEENLAFCRISE